MKINKLNNNAENIGLVLNKGESATLHSGTTLCAGTVNSGGKIIVFDGGKITDTILANGDAALDKREKLLVHQGGIAENINVSNGCDFLNFGYAFHTILSGHRDGDIGDFSDLFVRSGGVAEDIIVYNGGHFNITSAKASQLLVSSGGTAEIEKDGFVSNVLIAHGGSMGVYDRGTVFNTHLSSGGVMNLASGATHSGSLQIEDGAAVSACQGAVIDFSVAEQEKTSTALVNNWNLISGRVETSYTLTVNSDQADGVYTLAEGAADFDNIITVKTADNITLGTLSVGETKDFDGTDYTLTKTGSALDLIIRTAAPVPAKSDVDGNGVSDVVFQYTGGDCQIGFWMNGTSTWQGQGVGQPSNWEVLGAYDMDNNGKADIVMRGNVQIGANKGAYIGYYKDGDVTQWRNIDFLNNPYDIDWKLAIGNLTGNEGCNSIVWQAPDLGVLGVWTDGTSDWVSLGSGFNRNWEMIGCGDFDGNGKDEVLFSNNGNFYTTGIDQTFASLGGWGTEWQVKAIGDFSGDGKDDLILQVANMVVKFEDGKAEKWNSIGVMDASDWFIVGAGDYNGDEVDDLLVRQYSTGMLGYYISGDMSRWNEMGRGVDMNWTVIA